MGGNNAKGKTKCRDQIYDARTENLVPWQRLDIQAREVFPHNSTYQRNLGLVMSVVVSHRSGSQTLVTVRQVRWVSCDVRIYWLCLGAGSQESRQEARVGALVLQSEHVQELQAAAGGIWLR